MIFNHFIACYAIALLTSDRKLVVEKNRVIERKSIKDWFLEISFMKTGLRTKGHHNEPLFGSGIHGQNRLV